MIQFYEGAKKLTKEQKEKLDKAKADFVETQIVVNGYENGVQNQFSQTAEVKAEEKMIEWFLFNFSYYEEEVNEEKELFPIFVGKNFDEKRESYLKLCEDKEEIDDKEILQVKDIFDLSFSELARAVNIWYNKMGKNTKEIKAKMKEIFEPVK